MLMALRLLLKKQNTRKWIKCKSAEFIAWCAIHLLWNIYELGVVAYIFIDTDIIPIFMNAFCIISCIMNFHI